MAAPRETRIPRAHVAFLVTTLTLAFAGVASADVGLTAPPGTAVPAASPPSSTVAVTTVTTATTVGAATAPVTSVAAAPPTPAAAPTAPVAPVPAAAAPVAEAATAASSPVAESATGGAAPVVETVSGASAAAVETATEVSAPVVETVTPVVEAATPAAAGPTAVVTEAKAAITETVTSASEPALAAVTGTVDGGLADVPLAETALEATTPVVRRVDETVSTLRLSTESAALAVRGAVASTSISTPSTHDGLRLAAEPVVGAPETRAPATTSTAATLVSALQSPLGRTRASDLAASSSTDAGRVPVAAHRRGTSPSASAATAPPAARAHGLSRSLGLLLAGALLALGVGAISSSSVSGGGHSPSSNVAVTTRPDRLVAPAIGWRVRALSECGKPKPLVSCLELPG